MSKISVLTLTRNRTDHLQNLLKGLALSSRLPDECVVVHMNEPAQSLGDWPFACQHSTYENLDVSLPLSEARNAAAARSTGDLLLFLDVDCIPAEEMVAEYAKACEQVPSAIAMGNVHYLAQKIAPDWTEDWLKAQSAPHPIRNAAKFSPLAKEANYGLFWSLSFALSRTCFEQIGGFSESYSGYGAEDTDFAWKARASGVDLCWVPAALAFHQFHASVVPPWHHFKDITHNAQVFYAQWGEWPMGGWLKAFTEAGYIDWAAECDRLEVIRLPAQA